MVAGPMMSQRCCEAVRSAILVTAWLLMTISHRWTTTHTVTPPNDQISHSQEAVGSDMPLGSKAFHTLSLDSGLKCRVSVGPRIVSSSSCFGGYVFHQVPSDFNYFSNKHSSLSQYLFH